MYVPRPRSALLLLAAAAGLSACTSYGDGYGYGSVSVGYGTSGYCDPYYDDCYYGRGYGGYGRYGSYDPWYGWYGEHYYPGIGVFVYDRWGRSYRWNDNDRRYWEGRRQRWGNRDWNDRRWENWNGYRRNGTSTGNRTWTRDGRNWRRRN